MLEIHVSDQIKTFDDLEKTIEFVVEQLKQWHESGQDIPLNVFVKSTDNKSPPALNINVSESVKTVTAFG